MPIKLQENDTPIQPKIRYKNGNRNTYKTTIAPTAANLDNGLLLADLPRGQKAFVIIEFISDANTMDKPGLLLLVFLYFIFSMDTEQSDIFEKRTARLFVSTIVMPFQAFYNF